MICLVNISGEKVSTSCDKNLLSMSCKNSVIIVQRAIYGREDSTTCRPNGDDRDSMYDPARCLTLVDMTAVVRYHCQFQPNCEFDVTQVPFDFECPDIVPYLRVSYNCLPLIGDFPRAPPQNSRDSTTTTTPKATLTTKAVTTQSTTQQKQQSIASVDTPAAGKWQ